MKIVVNDANILIDLVELELLPHFFGLKFKFQTTDLVINELLEDQFPALLPYIDQKMLIIKETTHEDLVEIKTIESLKPSLSTQDCSAFHHARTLGTILITSDNALRKFGKENKIEIHGHLWIFDHMLAAKTITNTKAAKKLIQLCEEVNTKLGLPKQECTKRIKKWKSD